MNRFKLFLTSVGLFFLPLFFALADAASDEQAIKDATGAANDFVKILNQEVLFPIIALLSAIALLVFVYGSVVYIFNGGNETAREKGKSHIMYGIIGLLIMVSAWGILSLVAGSIGAGAKLGCADDPTQPGCPQEFMITP